MEIEWKTHPLTEKPVRSVLLIATLTVIGYFVPVIFKAGLFLILYVIIMLFNFAAYWFPTHYRLDDEGIRIKRLWVKVVKSWADYKKVYFDPNGFFLSPFAKKNYLERTRGIYVICPPEKYEAAKKIIEEKIKGD